MQLNLMSLHVKYIVIGIESAGTNKNPKQKITHVTCVHSQSISFFSSL